MSDDLIEVPVRLPKSLLRRLLRIVLWRRLMWDETVQMAIYLFVKEKEEEYKERYGVPIDP